MKYAKLLLEIMTEKIPPGPDQHHNFTLDNNNDMLLSLMCGDTYHRVIVDTEDFDKPISELAEEIYQLLEPHLGVAVK